MSKVMLTESHLQDIADAIRGKNGSIDAYTPGQMAEAILSIPTSGITPTGTKNITQNGTYDVTEFASANVYVQPNLQSKTATQNGTVTPDQGYDGLSSVVVNVPSGGGGGDVVLWDSAIGASGSGIAYNKTVTIETAGTYSIRVGGAITSLGLTINETQQTTDFVYANWYAKYYDKTVNLSVGDTITITGQDTGRSYMFAGVILQS